MDEDSASSDVLNESTMGDTIIPHTLHPPATYGWVNHKLTNMDSEEIQDESWNLRWLAVESGFFFWYLNDMMGSPEGFKQLKNLDVQLTDEEDGSDHFIVKLIDHSHSEMHEFQFANSNASIWKNSISQNKHIDTHVASLSLADYRMEDVDIALPASMQIHLKGSPHTLSVGPEDDTSRLTTEFVQQHNLKSDIKPRIEAELLRTQVDSCLAFQHKLRTQIAHLRRLVIESSIYEPRALAAEALASRTSDELKGLGQISIDISNKMKSLRAECDEKNQEIGTLTSDLLKEQTAVHQYKEASSAQLETCQKEIEILQKQVKSLKKFRKVARTEEEDPLDTTMVQEAIAEIESKTLLLEQQEQRISDLVATTEAMEIEKGKIERSHSECAEANAILQQTIQDYKSSEKSNADVTEHLRRKLIENDETTKTLRRQLKTAADKADMSKISEQLNESKVKKMTEDNRRATATIQSLRLTMLGLEASRQENQDLQEQLHAAETQLLAFKNHSSVKLLHNVNEENASLKEQSLRLRGEVLALQDKLEEIESSAFSAVNSMQLLQTGVGGGSVPPRSSDKVATSDELSLENDGNGEEKVIVELIMEEDSSVSDYQSERNLRSQDAVTPNQASRTADDVDMDDEETDTDIEVDFNMSQSFADTSKEDEKNAAALSPIVEDRLLRNIFAKYTTETAELLTLTRFGRFTKEFKIAGLVKAADRYSASGMKKTDAVLVYGDVDVVFMNTVKNIPAKENDGPMNMLPTPSSPTTKGGSSRSGLKSPQAFYPGGGKITSPRTTAMTQIKGSHLSANQFIAAVQDLAVRLYSSVIEEKTGTVLDCLPEKQKKMAMRAAMDVMVLKKLMPHASTLGLVPWELMFLDQTLTTIHSNDIASRSLVGHISKVSAWFMHYSKVIEISLFSNVPERSRHSMSPMMSPSSYNGRSPNFKANNSRSSFGGSKGHIIEAPEMLSFRGLPYKALSKFFHDYGVIPYLIKDPQLFSMFTEVNMWSKGNIGLLLTALPQEVQELAAVALEMSNQPEVSAKLAKKKFLLCGSFFVLFAAIANQAFDEILPEKRIARLFEWTAQSGGSYLMQKRK